MNHCACRKVRQSFASGLLIFSALGALALPVRAHAQWTGSASASSQYSSTSNLFAQDTGQPGTNGSQRSDTTFGYGAAADGTYKWSRQTLYVTANVSQSDYQEHLDLNHYSYGIGTGLKWKVAEILDGSIDLSRTRAMVPFLDLTGSESGEELSLLTAQTESMQVGLKLSSEWKLAGSAAHSESTQTTAGAPDQVSRQTSGTMSLEYAGFGRLTSGLTASYASGDSSGSDIVKNPPYTQTSAGFLANYKLPRTTFDGQVTYSRRSFSGSASDPVSGVTGALNFSDQLTAKTSFFVNISRGINTQYLNLGSEIDTSAGVGVTWNATPKIGTSLSYTFNYRDFPAQDQVQPGAATGDTIDRNQNASLALSYHPLKWLTFGAYANVQTRSSDTAGRNFNSTAYGVSVSATVGKEAAK